MGKSLIKLKILLKENAFLLLLFILWFIANFIIFSYLTNWNYMEALLIIFYFTQHDSIYGNFYQVISEFIIFGIIFSVLATGFFRKYNPQQTALQMARSMKNHVVIIGYSHLGQRIRDFLIANKIKYVIIEPEYEPISHLIKNEEPVIPKSPNNEKVLKDANIEKAKLVVTTKNDLETLIVSVALTRNLNPDCDIVCRCFNDSIAEMLESTYNCETISTSKYASNVILDHIYSIGAQSVIIIGYTNTTQRLIKAFKKDKIKYTIIEKNREKVADILDDEPIIVGDGKDKENLEKAGINNIDAVIVLIDNANEVILISNSIREMNTECMIICRFFYEDVGKILEKPPFNAKIISQSKNALNEMIKQGFFDIFIE